MRGILILLLAWTASAQYSPPSGGGGGTPGGSSNQYQYNSGGLSFGGSDILSYDGTNRRNVMTRSGLEFDGVAAPGPPTAALITATGNIDAGAHQYCVTYVTPQGETQCSTPSNVVTTDASNAQINVSGLGSTCPTGATGKNVYRSPADFGESERLLPTTPQPLACATTSVVDNTADAGLGAFAIWVNTTAGSVVNGTTATLGNAYRLGSGGSGFDQFLYQSNQFGRGSDFSDSAFYSTIIGTDPNLSNYNTFSVGQNVLPTSNTTSQASTALRIYQFGSGTGNIALQSGLLLVQNGVPGTSPTLLAGLNADTDPNGATPLRIAAATLAVNSENGSTTIPEAEGYRFSSVMGSGTFTNLYQFHATTPGLFGGNITNLYGVLVDDQTGATNNWAIKTGLGKVSFGDLTSTVLLQNVPTSTDPICAVTGDIGKLWFDSTTNTTAFKVCKSVAGTVGWSTVTTVP